MKQKNPKILLICMEVISLGIIIPIIYCGTLKLLMVPIADAFYSRYPHPYEHRWIIFPAVLLLDVLWIILMRLCPRDKIHVKVVLTLLILALSASVLSCFVICHALGAAFS
jgi:hypothetical protein